MSKWLLLSGCRYFCNQAACVCVCVCVFILTECHTPLHTKKKRKKMHILMARGQIKGSDWTIWCQSNMATREGKLVTSQSWVICSLLIQIICWLYTFANQWCTPSKNTEQILIHPNYCSTSFDNVKFCPFRVAAISAERCEHRDHLHRQAKEVVFPPLTLKWDQRRLQLWRSSAVQRCSLGGLVLKLKQFAPANSDEEAVYFCWCCFQVLIFATTPFGLDRISIR